LDIFTGGDLGECYNFDVGTITTTDQFGTTGVLSSVCTSDRVEKSQPECVY
jgi:hypothetical protein